ncbi:hypothetical protein AVEN_207653-1 [Araneus ventricosus]|uniref:Uncharacterized protein n=1 Tax=Araneus ventricosus TaxID=182803 RepID=A0A4Y2JPD8_ARAVE|nr:hypothetical protein AVEN_207653-1 [Araneus ventricosus]
MEKFRASHNRCNMTRAIQSSLTLMFFILHMILNSKEDQSADLGVPGTVLVDVPFPVFHPQLEKKFKIRNSMGSNFSFWDSRRCAAQNIMKETKGAISYPKRNICEICPDSNFSLQQSCSNLALQICNKVDTARVQA